MKTILRKLKNIGFKNICLMNVGFICCAIASYVFISPARIVASGATGLAVFFSDIFNIPYYFFLYGINIILVIISFPLLGKAFSIKTIFGSIMLPTYGFVVDKIFTLLKSKEIFDVNEIVVNSEAAFIVIFAAALMGFGIGINMKLGGSTGGFDILEAIFNKYFHIPYSTSVYALDTIIVVLGVVQFDKAYNTASDTSSFLFASGFAEGMAAVVYILIIGFLIDAITFGGYNKRAVFIRSCKYQEIHDYIINNLVRGLTYLDAHGGYSNDNTEMIVTIVYSKEYFKLRDKIQQIDPNAFIFVTKATEVRGLGFNFETPEHLARHTRKKQKKLNNVQN